MRVKAEPVSPLFPGYALSRLSSLWHVSGAALWVPRRSLSDPPWVSMSLGKATFTSLQNLSVFVSVGGNFPLLMFLSLLSTAAICLLSVPAEGLRTLTVGAGGKCGPPVCLLMPFLWSELDL